jgi:MFS family permease
VTASFFSRERIVASPGWSRWLVPPAALSIHLSIGAAYSWSVFKKPLEGALHISGTLSALPFTIGIVVLGLSAAIFGTWVDRNGPRMAMFAAMCCFCGGWLIGSAGLATRQYWLVLLGYGLVGGIGWGIGYISPVSTLIKWFPDKPGMATGLAIMGFGGGALIASPWSTAMLGAGATGRLETARLDSRAADGGLDRHRRSGLGHQRDQDTAVLAVVGGVVLQRDCGYRHP